MRFYNQPHAFYCGVDLHARSMFTHILNHDGNTVFEADLPAGPDAFRNAIAPFRAGLVVGCECMFSWYWLADLCEDDEIPFTLGHALYMKAIHGGKAKNDRIDAAKIDWAARCITCGASSRPSICGGSSRSIPSLPRSTGKEKEIG